MRLDKYLSKYLNLSRKDLKKYMKNHTVKINDKNISDLSINVSFNDSIYLDNELIEYSEYIYLMMNKPSGFVCSTSNIDGISVLSLLPSKINKKELSIVGRLDKDTKGLLLLTNDGTFLHNVTSPKKNITKTYYVEFSGTISSIYKKVELSGIQFKDYTTKPFEIYDLCENSLYIKVTEGKFHEVKKIIHYLGGEVTLLKRVQIGSLSLNDLKEGEIRLLSEDELREIGL